MPKFAIFTLCVVNDDSSYMKSWQHYIFQQLQLQCMTVHMSLT